MGKEPMVLSPQFSEDEVKLMKIACKQAIGGLARSGARAAIPLVQQAYSKQAEVYHEIIRKLEGWS